MQADLEVLVFQLQKPQIGKEQKKKEKEEEDQELQLHALVPKDMISQKDRLNVSDSGMDDNGNASLHTAIVTADPTKS